MTTAAPGAGVFGNPLDRGAMLGAVGLSVIYAGFIILQASPTSFYTLDDPYIHMALAENIARGHYGVNLEDVSNPSSSILWPFLLAACERIGLLIWAPLLINIASFALTIRLLFGFAADRLSPGRDPTNVLIFIGLAAFAFNLFGVIFTGMEHSLHTLVSVAAITGVLDRRYDRITMVALVASPLLRFEGAAILAFAVAMALYDRRLVFAAITTGIAVMGFGAYFAWLTSLGLPMLPSSVLAKSAVSSSMVDGGGSILDSLLRNAGANLVTDYAALFGLFALAFCAAVWKSRGRDRMIALGFLGMTCAAFLLGRMDSYSRYEVYILCVLTVGAIHLFPAGLGALLQKRVFAILFGCALFLMSNLSGITVARTTPMAARNIDRQQHQMHRLIVECWRAPIAVNDLGWTSFRNDAYVLDLAGLGNEAARKARAAGAGGWVSRLVAEHHVEAAAIYANWFIQPPADWIRVGDLVLDDPRVTPFGATVSFYATTTEAAARLRTCLVQLGQSVPAGASVHIS